MNKLGRVLCLTCTVWAVSVWRVDVDNAVRNFLASYMAGISLVLPVTVGLSRDVMMLPATYTLHEAPQSDDRSTYVKVS